MENYTSISAEELARRCAISGEIAAWEEFVRRFHRLIARVVLRIAMRFGDSSKQTVDDLIQETYLKFSADNCRRLRDFEHRHPNAFVGYVQVVAANVARDHFKSSYSKKRGSNQVENVSEDHLPPAGDESAGSPKAIERAILIREVQSHLELCLSGADHDRNRKIFWFYYRAGLSAAAIAAMPGIGLTTKGVESLLLRITRELRERITTSNLVEGNLTENAREGIVPADSF